ncbi:hypothetical protein Tco_1133410 [Tanacetum coccineum]
MIHEPGDPNSVPPVAESTHEQTDDELTEKEVKQICDTAREIWLLVEQKMKASSIGVQEKKDKLFNEWERFTSTEGESIELYYHHPTTAMNMALVLMAKAFKLNYSTPTNNNQRTSSNPRNRQITQPSMNMGQERQIHLVGGNGGNQFRQNARQIAGNQNGYNAVQNVRNQVIQNAVQNPGVQNVGNQNGLIVVPGIANQNANQTRNGNVVAARAGGNGNGNNEEQYTKLLEPITERHTVQQINSNVISVEYSMEHNGGTIEQHPATIEETRAYFESLYNNFVTEVEKVNTVNHKMRETNADLTTEIASSTKQIRTLNEEITNLNNKLSKEKSTVSLLQEEKKRLKSDFKTREDELLDKQIQYEKNIKELDNILVKTGQSIQTMHMLSPKPNSFYHTKQKMALGYQNPFYLKQAQQKQQSLYNGRVLLEKHDPPTMYDSEETLQLAQESRLK